MRKMSDDEHDGDDDNFISAVLIKRKKRKHKIWNQKVYRDINMYLKV